MSAHRPDDPPAGFWHVSDQDLSAFVDGTLAAPQRSRVAAHLADCAECRSELAAVTRAMQTFNKALPWQRGSRIRWVAAAAAAVLVAAVLYDSPVLTPGVSPIERPGGEGFRTVTIIRPAEGATIEADSVLLAWRGETSTSFRVTVADEGGATLWSSTTSDSTLTVPASALAGRGHVFYWYVDALHADGSSSSSGARSFSTPGP